MVWTNAIHGGMQYNMVLLFPNLKESLKWIRLNRWEMRFDEDRVPVVGPSGLADNCSVLFFWGSHGRVIGSNAKLSESAPRIQRFNMEYGHFDVFWNCIGFWILSLQELR